MTNSTIALREARDLLLNLREDYDAATATFEWPEMGANFNFAHDWFDVFARGNTDNALVIVEEDDTRQTFTFDDMATRSDRLAVWLDQQGVKGGDSVILMLGNQAEAVGVDAGCHQGRRRPHADDDRCRAC